MKRDAPFALVPHGPRHSPVSPGHRSCAGTSAVTAPPLRPARLPATGGWRTAGRVLAGGRGWGNGPGPGHPSRRGAVERAFAPAPAARRVGRPPATRGLPPPGEAVTKRTPRCSALLLIS